MLTNMDEGRYPQALPLGHYLDCPDEYIESALASQLSAAIGGKRLGEVLLQDRLISQEQLDQGLIAQRVDRLRRCPLFADFSRANLERVSKVFREVSIEPDQAFIRQGHFDNHLYVLASGKLQIYRETEEGERLELGFAGPGEPVGEIAYVSGGIRTASVKTVGRCHLLSASFSELRVLLEKVPALSHALMHIITRRLMNTTSRFEEQTRRLHKVERSLEQLNEFLNLSGAAEIGAGVEQLLERLVATASNLTDADRATLFLLDSETGELWSKIAEGHHVREIRVPQGVGVAGWAAENRELVNIENAYADQRFSPDTDKRTGYRTQSILCAPIWSLAGEILGVVQVVNKLKGTFAEDDEAVIRAFAHQAAVAVENFYLYSQVMASHRQIGVLLELSKAITQTLDIETLIGRVVTGTAKAMNCDRSSFWVLDAERQELWSMDASGGEMEEVRIPADSGLAGHAATYAETVRVPDAYQDARFNQEVDRQTGYRTRDVLCTPVMNRAGRVVGVTQCINKLAGRFDETDEKLARGIATHIAIGLENAQMHARAVEMRTYLENVQGSIASGIVSLDEEGRVITANKAARNLFSGFADLGESRRYENLLGPANHELSRIIAEGYRLRARVSENSVPCHDHPASSTASTVNVEVLPLEDSEGQFKGLVSVLEDVTNERRIKSAFGQYLAPAVIEQLLADPDGLRLGGEKREVTAMFTDIENFTRLSEAVDPSELVKLLNEYFDGACEIVLRHGGTIDKIVGDSLHVLFNAPADQPDHADRAVRCAIELQAFSQQLARQRAEEAYRLGRTRIGVNTGECVVGNFGGAARFDYTAHGDAINTAARLEGANKYLGTTVCVSEATRRQCRSPGQAFRPVGSLRLKGKTESIAVFEPVHLTALNRPLFDAYREAFQALESGSEDALALFDNLSQASPDDELVAYHRARLAVGETGTDIILSAK